MSGSRPIPASQQSNEDLVENLAKNLEESMLPKDEDEPFVIEPGSVIPPPSEEEIKKSQEQHNPEPEDSIESDTDSISSEMLREEDLKMSADQKEENKVIAEELKIAGNNAFRMNECDLAIEKYTESLRICPFKYCRDRAILYSNRAAARMKLEKYEKAIADCTKGIKEDDSYIKTYIRRAQCFEKTEKLDECLEDYKKILELDPSYTEARNAVLRLPKQIEERNEKLKTEMLGKLKDLGNLILKPFGLSTDNFQLQQNPDSKGYSVNFKK